MSSAVINQDGYPNEIKLDSAPSDGITAVRFSPYSKPHLLASSWDCTLRYYDVVNNRVDRMFELASPLLDCDLIDSNILTAGALDQNVYICYIRDGSYKSLGMHSNAVRCVRYCSSINAVVSGSWDYTVKGWDMRDHVNSFTLPQENKVYGMSVVDETLVVATSNRKILIWDLRNYRTPLKRDSSLKYQSRKIECFSDKQGYVISSIEGRVAVEFFDVEDQPRRYAFKCHRATSSDGIEIIHPVNAISFHPLFTTFATGGSDGLVSIWDPFHKKRICQLHRFETSISSVSFNIDGTSLAVAASYQYEENDKNAPPDAIYIRKLNENETKQRPI